MKSVTVTLAGEEHVINELPSNPSREWREMCEGPFDEIISAIAKFRGDEIDSVSDLMSKIGDIKSLLVKNIDVIGDLVIAYAGLDREWALDNVYDSEFMEAIVPIMTMAFPVDFLMGAVTKIGALPSPTTMNGRSPSMENGQTNSTKSS